MSVLLGSSSCSLCKIGFASRFYCSEEEKHKHTGWGWGDRQGVKSLRLQDRGAPVHLLPDCEV